jgi:hypothetical protein
VRAQRTWSSRSTSCMYMHASDTLNSVFKNTHRDSLRRLTTSLQSAAAETVQAEFHAARVLADSYIERRCTM